MSITLVVMVWLENAFLSTGWDGLEKIDNWHTVKCRFVCADLEPSSNMTRLRCLMITIHDVMMLAGDRWSICPSSLTSELTRTTMLECGLRTDSYVWQRTTDVDDWRMTLFLEKYNFIKLFWGGGGASHVHYLSLMDSSTATCISVMLIMWGAQPPDRMHEWAVDGYECKAATF